MNNVEKVGVMGGGEALVTGSRHEVFETETAPLQCSDNQFKQVSQVRGSGR